MQTRIFDLLTRVGIRRGLGATIMAGGLLLLASVAAAAGGGATTTTTVVIQQTATLPFTNPCTGATATVTVTFNAVFHETDRPVGTLNLLNNLAGDFTLVPDDPTQPTVTGHFADVFVIGGGANLTQISTINAQGIASDGTPFSLHFLMGITENGIDVVVVSFTKCA